MKLVWALWALVDSRGQSVMEYSPFGGGTATVRCDVAGKAQACARMVSGPGWSMSGAAWTMSDGQTGPVALVTWQTSTRATLTVGPTTWSANLSYPRADHVREPPAKVSVATWIWDGSTMSHDNAVVPGLWLGAVINCRAGTDASYFEPIVTPAVGHSVPAVEAAVAGSSPKVSLTVDVRPCPNLAGELSIITDEREYYKAQRDAFGRHDAESR